MNMNKKLEGHPISKVDPGSIGEELELEPGDRVLTINGNPVEDIFDYEYYVNQPVHDHGGAKSQWGRMGTGYRK